jgi:Leucine-rich repeat (LRR) protein
LNDLPNGIEFLFCNNNEIKTLNCLPRNLKYLYCYDNDKNIELKNLPASIEKILN